MNNLYFAYDRFKIDEPGTTQITVRIFDPSNGSNRLVLSSIMKVSVVPLAATEFEVTFDETFDYCLGMNFPRLNINFHDENANIVNHEGYIKMRIEEEGDDKAFEKIDGSFKVLHKYTNSYPCILATIGNINIYIKLLPVFTSY